MYCFDSNIVIEILRGNPELRTKLETIQKVGIEVSLTFLSLAELSRGAQLSSKPEESTVLIDDFVDNVTLLNFSKKSCKIYGEDYAQLRKKGQLAPEMDLLIASIAKAEGQVLVTRNEKDFKNIPDLKVERW